MKLSRKRLDEILSAPNNTKYQTLVSDKRTKTGFNVVGCCAHLRAKTFRQIRPYGTLILTHKEIAAYVGILCKAMPKLATNFRSALRDKDYTAKLNRKNAIQNYGILLFWRHIWRDPRYVASVIWAYQNGLTPSMALVYCRHIGSKYINQGSYWGASNQRLMRAPELLNTIFEEADNTSTDMYDSFVCKVLSKHATDGDSNLKAYRRAVDDFVNQGYRAQIENHVLTKFVNIAHHQQHHHSTQINYSNLLGSKDPLSRDSLDNVQKLIAKGEKSAKKLGKIRDYYIETLEETNNKVRACLRDGDVSSAKTYMKLTVNKLAEYINSN